MSELEHLGYMQAEHEAWLELVDELRRAGAGRINRGEPNERLHDAIVRWGEELAQLRIFDPEPAHAERALIERREAWARWS
jgi:hypothetical protein